MNLEKTTHRYNFHICKDMATKFKKKINQSDKFTFTIDFQLEVLRFLIQNKESVLIIQKIKPGYFTLIEHSIIMESLLKFHRKYGKLPSETLLKETCNSLLSGKDFVDLVTKEDIPNINRIINNLYSIPLRDSDVIKENIFKFIAYIEMKTLNESMDFTNFNLYEDYQNKVSKIIRNSKPQKKDEPLYMVGGTVKRQLMRRVDPDIIPTPYWQLNNLSNGGGYSKGSIFVILDKPKAKKTFALINISRGYLTMKKNVLYIDTENGKNQIMERMVQSTLNKTKKEIVSGEQDKLEQRHMRKYKRLGVEFIVERVPALVSDANVIKGIIKKIEADTGIKIHILMIDYAAKLASISKDKDDTERINNVYIDLDNLASELELEAIWTAQHVKREASKRKGTRYEDNDIASAISIIRNAQCIIGLNSTDDEEEHGIQRMEIVVQRDGKSHGRCLFNFDSDRQRWKEFSREAREKYDKTLGKIVDEMIRKESTNGVVKKSNPIADPEKANHKGGDI